MAVAFVAPGLNLKTQAVTTPLAQPAQQGKESETFKNSSKSHELTLNKKGNRTHLQLSAGQIDALDRIHKYCGVALLTALVAGQVSSSFPTAAAAAASIAGALVARSVGRQRRRLPKARVQRRASTLDQLKEVTGKDGGIPLQLRYVRYEILMFRTGLQMFIGAQRNFNITYCKAISKPFDLLALHVLPLHVLALFAEGSCDMMRQYESN
jgi:hypothetical protein